MIDIASLKNYIIEDESRIPEILEASGFYEVTDMGAKEYRCAERPGGSLKIRVSKDSLASVIYGTDVSGDIITLVQHQTGMELREALKFVCDELGVSNGEIAAYEEKTNPFGSFFDEVENDTFGKSENKLVEIDEDDAYSSLLVMPSKLFTDDGVPVDQQRRFKIAFDYHSNRVCIPYRDSMGRLVGIEGRLNKEELDDDDIKYFPIYSYPKTQTLFGYYENYNHILQKGVVIIVESAKSVMKLAGMGIDYSVAVGKAHISDFQMSLIRALAPSTVIIAFDEDVEELRLLSMAENLKNSNMYVPLQVGYIKDRENKIMPKGSNLSPADLTKEEFAEVLKNMTYFV